MKRCLIGFALSFAAGYFSAQWWYGGTVEFERSLRIGNRAVMVRLTHRLGYGYLFVEAEQWDELGYWVIWSNGVRLP